MKRHIVRLVLVLTCLCGARSALAESPQRFAFELKFGPYGPALDDTEGLGGKRPFSAQFGDPTDPYGAPPGRALLSMGEFDYQFLHRFGVLGIGLSAGYYRKTAAAFQNIGAANIPKYCTVADDGNGNRVYLGIDNKPQNPPSPCFSGDEVHLNIVPIELLAIYRFDVLDKRFHIPLIPYLKLGLGYYFFWFGNSGSFVSQATSVDGNGKEVKVDASGGVVGFVLHPGLALDLSAIDPGAARAIDQEIGLNRVTAFIEMHGAWITGCHCNTMAMKLNLSDITFTAGLGFEF